jgi:hypothetical protein
MNKHIELVKKWLADPESVSLEELEANNRTAAWDAWDVKAVDVAWAAYWAVRADAEDAAYWRNRASEYIEEYEELTQ